MTIDEQEFEEILEDAWENVTHPSNFFKHFTVDEFYDWVMEGTYDEILNVHKILVQHGFNEFANMVVDILLHWNDTKSQA